MDHKRLVAIGIEGPAPDVTRVPGATLIPSSEKGRSIVVFGLVRRDEADIERALRLACDQGSPAHRMSVKEISVPVGDGRLPTRWRELFESDFRPLADGDIRVSPSIAKIYERQFLFERSQEGGEEIFFLRGERKRPTRLRGLTPEYTPIVGRTRELKRLEELIEQAGEDQGQIAALVGEAGIGKTRLLLETKTALQQRSVSFLEGQFQQKDTVPYAAFRPIVVGLAGSQIETLSRWSMTDAETDFLRLFLHPGVRIERLVGMSQEEIRQGLFFSVRKLLHAAAQTPMALILEDLHWADRPSLDLLNYILDGIEETKLLVLLTYRPEIEDPWSKRLNFMEIQLMSFEEEEVDRFIRSVLRVEQVPMKFQSDLLKLSLGNPLFIEELLRQLLDSGTLRIETAEKDKRFLKVHETTLPELPTTLHTLIASRFDRLSTVSQEALRWAALFGPTFDVTEVETFLKEVGDGKSAAPLEEAEQRSFVREESAFPKRQYRFVHDLIFEVVAQSMTDSEKEPRNTQIAEFLTRYHADRIADHLNRISNHYLRGTLSESALDFALRAGKKAEESHQPLHALALYGRAVFLRERLPKAKPKSERLFLAYARAAVTVGQIDETERAFALWTSAGVSKDPLSQGTFESLQMTYFNAKGDYARAFEASERAITAFRSRPELKPALFDLMHDRVHTLISLGRHKDAIHESLVGLREMGNDPAFLTQRMRVWARVAFSITATGNSEHAAEYVERAASLITSETPPHAQIDVFSRFTAPYLRMGRYQEIIQIYSRIVKIARTAGLKQLLARLLFEEGIFRAEDGDYVKGLQDYDASVEEARQIRNESIEMRAFSTKLDTLVDLGAHEAGRALWRAHEQRFLTLVNPWYRVGANAAHADLLALEGRIPEALELYKKSQEEFQKTGHKVMVYRSFLWSILLQAQNHTRALTEILSDFDAFTERHAKTDWPDHLFMLQAVAMTIAARGGSPKRGLDPNMNPKNCPMVWLRQLCYVAKIEWLDAQKKFKEADDLRDKYRQEREKIAERVPDEYKADFMNHPLYRVPKRSPRGT